MKKRQEDIREDYRTLYNYPVFKNYKNYKDINFLIDRSRIYWPPAIPRYSEIVSRAFDIKMEGLSKYLEGKQYPEVIMNIIIEGCQLGLLKEKAKILKEIETCSLPDEVKEDFKRVLRAVHQKIRTSYKENRDAIVTAYLLIFFNNAFLLRENVRIHEDALKAKVRQNG